MTVLPTFPRKLYKAGTFDGFVAGRDFTPGNAKAMIWMSQLAYETDTPDKITDVLSSWGMQLVDGGIIANKIAVLPQAITRGIVAAGHGATIVAFAGTDPGILANWLTDFDAHVGRAQTADGYRVAADAVWEQVKTAITLPGLANNKVLVTGP